MQGNYTANCLAWNPFPLEWHMVNFTNPSFGGLNDGLAKLQKEG